MLRGTLNLGILAHVDAGKTTLTERLLHAAGVIDAVGSVDRGTTRTDTLALERERGITIKAAVVSFAVADVTINLIDTPGHPDFIAEVERVLGVLDGAVLVISAVEGVQPQTRLLMRALQRAGVPTLVFVNKIDRAGADVDRVLAEIAAKLTPAIAPLRAAERLGGRNAAFVPFEAGDARFHDRLAELLAERDDRLLAAYVEDSATVSDRTLREELAAQSKRAELHPVFAGSALTGAGVEELLAGIAELLPAGRGDAEGPVSGSVFKIERGAGGEKLAYVRLFTGTLGVRDRVRFGAGLEGRVTGIDVFEAGAAVRRPSVSAGRIGKVRGLAEVRIGDRIGDAGAVVPRHAFAPPTLEAVVAAVDPADRERLRAALARLTEEDPLIDVRQDELDELSVSLYGEVQKEVIQATLARDYGLEAAFRETTTICVERPSRAGEAVELLHAETNPYLATIGLRVEPAPVDPGVEFRLAVDPRTAPLYAYKRLESFAASMEGYVREALRAGRHGWQVTDCVVTMTDCAYSVPDGPPSRRGPLSTPADFRKLTPLVLAQALARAGTVVCEPMLRVGLEVPIQAVGAVLAAVARLGGTVGTPSARQELSTIETVLPAAQAQELQRQLPRLTGGEGVAESEFAGYRAVDGPPPSRPRARTLS